MKLELEPVLMAQVIRAIPVAHHKGATIRIERYLTRITPEVCQYIREHGQGWEPIEKEGTE